MLSTIFAAETEKNASWLLGLFGIKETVAGAMVFLGVAVIVIAAISAVVTIGFMGQSGKQKVKQKLPMAILAALVAFAFLSILDFVVSTLKKTGDEIKKTPFEEIISPEASPALDAPVVVS